MFTQGSDQIKESHWRQKPAPGFWVTGWCASGKIPSQSVSKLRKSRGKQHFVVGSSEPCSCWELPAMRCPYILIHELWRCCSKMGQADCHSIVHFPSSSLILCCFLPPDGLTTGAAHPMTPCDSWKFPLSSYYKNLLVAAQNLTENDAKTSWQRELKSCLNEKCSCQTACLVQKLQSMLRNGNEHCSCWQSLNAEKAKAAEWSGIWQLIPI